MTLTDLGWDSPFIEQFTPLAEQDIEPARVLREHTRSYLVHTAQGEYRAEVSGRFRHEASGRMDFPAVGDWVAVRRLPEGVATIHGLLERQSALIRKEAGGRSEGQIVAANVDMVFLVSGLDGDFNLRRIERYLALAWDSGATPIIVLNKADLCEDIEGYRAAAGSVALGVAIVVVSAAAGTGVEELVPHLCARKTAVFLGSSGVGKSTLVNALLEDSQQETHAVREDDSRGRHTTTHRELFRLPGGALVIDTPGMRELQLWPNETGLEQAFGDIETIGETCRFRDCRHEQEPGCAIRAALEEGALDTGRWRSYRKLQRELDYTARRQSESVQRTERARWKQIAILQRRINKDRNRST